MAKKERVKMDYEEELKELLSNEKIRKFIIALGQL